MERGVEIFAAINLIVVGLSHALAPASWKAFFVHSKGAAGNIPNGFLSIGLGAFIVAFHPGFRGLVPALLTAYGWLLLAKGSLYLVFRTLGLKGIEMPTRKAPGIFVVPGALMVVLGSALLAAMRSGRMLFEAYESSDVRVRVDGESAVVTGRIRRRRTIAERTVEDRWQFTKSYARSGGAWRVRAFHASDAPGQ